MDPHIKDKLRECAKEKVKKILKLQELLNLESVSDPCDILHRYRWDVEEAYKQQINIKEGRPSSLAKGLYTALPVIDDVRREFSFEPRINPLHRSSKVLFNRFYYTLYNGIHWVFQFQDNEETPSFLSFFDASYSAGHPVFYEGTFMEMLNDGKNELRFMLVYLHKEGCIHSDHFCIQTLSNPKVIDFINSNFIFWPCSTDTRQGKFVQGLLQNYISSPLVGVLLPHHNYIAVVGRMQGFCGPVLFLQRVKNILRHFQGTLTEIKKARLDQFLGTSEYPGVQNALKGVPWKRACITTIRRRAWEERRRLNERNAWEKIQRAQNLACRRVQLLIELPCEPHHLDPQGVTITFQMPSDIVVIRRFFVTQSLEDLYSFVFFRSDCPENFEIIRKMTGLPLKCRRYGNEIRIPTIEDAGLEDGEVMYVNDEDI